MDNEILTANNPEVEASQTEQPAEQIAPESVEEELEQMNAEEVESVAEQEAVEAETPAEDEEEKVAPAAPARRAPQKIELVGSIIDDGNDMVFADMPGVRQNAEIARMKQDIHRKNICYAAVKGVEVTRDEKILIILKRDTLRIVIPAEDFFHFSQLKDIDQASAEERFLRYRRKASHYFKGVVSFLPLGMGEDEETGVPFVVASRKQAMEKLQSRHFFSRNADVKVGSVAKASIVSSGPRYAIVECLGIESVIGSGALSAFSYIEDVSEEYKPGMGLMVAVESLEVDRAKRKIDISLSHALIERSEAKVETVSERMINGRYDATVVASNDKFYFVIIEGMKIRGIVPKDYYYGTGELVRNDSVAFLVTGINKERNMLIGRCIKSN